MNTSKIRSLAGDVDKARQRLMDAEAVLAVINSKSTQDAIRVNIGGYSIQITDMDRHYQQRPRKHFEMMHRAARRAIEFTIDDLRFELKAAEKALIDEVGAQL